MLLVAYQCNGADLPKENLGRWARLRKTVHETEQESPLLFNALATLCEGCGALGSFAVAVNGIYNVTIQQKPDAVIAIVFSPIPYLAIKYLCAKPIRITGGACVQTKNWIFGSPKKADSDATPQ